LASVNCSAPQPSCARCSLELVCRIAVIDFNAGPYVLWVVQKSTVFQIANLAQHRNRRLWFVPRQNERLMTSHDGERLVLFTAIMNPQPRRLQCGNGCSRKSNHLQSEAPQQNERFAEPVIRGLKFFPSTISTASKSEVVFLRMKALDQVWPLLKPSSDPRVRSYTIHG